MWLIKISLHNVLPIVFGCYSSYGVPQLRRLSHENGLSPIVADFPKSVLAILSDTERC